MELLTDMNSCWVIQMQESENGSWHVPMITGDDLEAPRQWLCATRARVKSLHSLFSN